MLIAISMLVMASASAASVNNAKNNVTVFSVVKNTQTIHPMMISSNGISQGQTQYIQRTLTGFCTDLPFDLYWGNPSNSLSMTVFSPDGHIYGPSYDMDDGLLNGDIPGHLKNPSGVPQGTYYVRVYGVSVSGSQSYTLY